MKNRIEIKKSNNQIHFYLRSEKYGRQYLFSKPFTNGEYQYFKDGCSENQLRSYNRWNRNPRLDKTVQRVIRMCGYIERDLEASMEYTTVEIMPDSRTEKYRELASESYR